MDHFRVAVFAFASFCGGLTLLLLNNDSSRVSLALTQIDSLISAAEQTDGALQMKLREEVARRLEASGNPPWKYGNQWSGVVVWEYVGPAGGKYSMINVRDQKWAPIPIGACKAFKGGYFFFPKAENLEAIEKIWNCLHSTTHVVSPSEVYPKAYPHDLGDSSWAGWSFALGTMDDSTRVDPKNEVNVEFILFDPNNSEQQVSKEKLETATGQSVFGALARIDGLGRPDTWIPVVKLRTAPFANALDFWKRLAPELSAYTGDFQDAFPELFTVAREMKKESLSDVQKHLRSIKIENFKLMGIELPLRWVDHWGIIAVLGFQIYLFLLTASSPKTNQADQSSWIGSYKAWPARIFFTITLVALPVFTTLVILSRGSYGPTLRSILLVWIGVAGIATVRLVAFSYPKTNGSWREP